MILLLASCLSLPAQNGRLSGLYFDPAYYYGSVWPQNKTVSYLVQDHLRAFQLNIGVSTNGSKDWHKYLHFPRLGVGYYHSNLGNDNIFGEVNAFYGTAALKTFNSRLPVNLEHNLTAGLGFMTKSYFLHKNSLDITFGSPVNIFVQYALVVPVRLTPTIEIYGGGCFTHCSVAKIVRPNYGLHMLLLRAGTRINLHPVEIKAESDLPEISDISRHSFTVYMTGGVKQPEEYRKDLYMIYGIIPEYVYRLTHAFGFGAGMGMYYDNSLKPLLLAGEGHPPGFDRLFTTTAHLTSQLYIGSLIFLLQPALYLYKNDGGPREIPYKLGFRYQLSDHLSAAIVLKAHWIAHADFLEFGLGYTFKRKSKP